MHGRVAEPELLVSIDFTHAQRFLAVWELARKQVESFLAGADPAEVNAMQHAVLVQGIPDPIAFARGVNPVQDRIELLVVYGPVIPPAKYHLDEVPEFVSHGVGQDIQQVDLAVEILPLMDFPRG